MIHFGLEGIAYISAGALFMSLIVLSVLYLVSKFRRRNLFFQPPLCRIFVLFFLALAFAAPYTDRETGAETIPVLFDVSESIDPADGEQLLAAIKEFSGESLHLALYPFATKVSSAPFNPEEFSSYDELRKAFNSLDPLGTALSDSFDAVTNSKEVTNIILASDGFETRGSLRDKMASLNQRGIHVFPLAPGGIRVHEGVFRISHLYAPLTIPQLSSGQVRVTVENTTQKQQSGVLEIFQGNQSLYRQNIRIAARSEQVHLAQTLPANGGIEMIRAVLTPQENATTASERTTYISAEGRERILLLSGSGTDAAYLSRVLENQAYQLDNRIGSGIGGSESLGNYSTIILNNISLEQLGRSGADAVARAARSGKGLIMVGGERSFGLGGYRGTIIEEALPVELLPPQREEKRLNVAVMLVIDKSRSMDADNKMDYAKEAARTFIANLKDDDFIGVIAFDASPFIVVRLGQLAEIRAVASDRIARIFPTGSTRPLSAIDEARRALMRVNAGRKHMLFLTDGEIEDAGVHYKELVKEMRILGITSSTVMLGSEADGGFLRSLAEQGGGAYYQTQDARSLPRIFLNDVRVAGGEQTMKEKKTYTIIPSNHMTSTDISSFPALLGYVQTRAKAAANLEIQISDGEKSEPLLARWQYGQGRVIAFTSDANGRWSRDWIEWGAYHRFWNDLLNSVRPETEVGGEKIPFDLRQFVENGKLVLEYALYDDNLSGTLIGKLKVPGEEARDLPFHEISPGRYRAELPDPPPGRYDLVSRLGSRSTAPVAFAVADEGFKEQRGMGFNMALLEMLAQTTGGTINPSYHVLRDAGSRELARVDRRDWFVSIAIFFALLEILFREVVARRRPRAGAYRRSNESIEGRI